ncbi:ATP-binding protein [Streptomyces wuyuanensis]|uniref:ATP-binding protein n=1 Tax=Streptomyces wuyuanensis TaxID=1196353 RepID=UPI003442C6F4
MTTVAEEVLRTVHPGGREGAVRQAREMVADVLEACREFGCQVDNGRADDVLLVVSELVTNACRHAGGADEVRALWRGGNLTIEVEDSSNQLPREPAEEAKGENGGYGCQLVTVLADGWGASRRETESGGKIVYASFSIR